MKRHGPVWLWIAASAMTFALALAVWRPIIDPTLHNAAVGAGLLIGASGLVAASMAVRTAKGWLAVGLSIFFIGFLVRGLPVLVAYHPPLHDGYFYLISVLNVAELGTLDPGYRDWYSQVGQQLSWPVLQLLTLQVSSWSGASVVELWKFLPAAIGALTFYAVGLIAHQTFGSWRVAALAGTLGSFGDVVLYYQSEYQPQGLAIVSLLVFLFLVVASRDMRAIGVRVLMLLVGAALLFTHHASTLLLGMVVVPLLIAPIVAEAGLAAWRARAPNRPAPRIMVEVSELAQYRSVTALLIVTALALHLTFFDEISTFVLLSLDPFAFFSSRELAVQEQPELWFSALRSAKYLILLLGTIGIVVWLRHGKGTKLLLPLLAIGLFLGTAVALVVLPSGVARLFAVTVPIAAIFAAFLTDRILTRWHVRASTGAAIAVFGVYVFCGILNAQSPSLAYLFLAPPQSAGAWYGGALPRTDALASAGEWIRAHDQNDRVYAVDFATRVGPIYYGRIADTRVIFDQPNEEDYCAADSFVVDYDLPDGPYSIPESALRDVDRVYDNGAIAIFERQGGQC